jgi:hypothetical protein
MHDRLLYLLIIEIGSRCTQILPVMHVSSMFCVQLLQICVWRVRQPGEDLEGGGGRPLDRGHQT